MSASPYGCGPVDNLPQSAGGLGQTVWHLEFPFPRSRSIQWQTPAIATVWAGVSPEKGQFRIIEGVHCAPVCLSHCQVRPQGRASRHRRRVAGSTGGVVGQAGLAIALMRFTVSGSRPRALTMKSVSHSRQSARCANLVRVGRVIAWAPFARAEVHLQQLRIGEELGAARPAHDPAAVENDGAIGDGEHLPRLLFDDHRGDAFLAPDAAKRREDLLDDERRQTLPAARRAGSRAGLSMSARPIASICCSPPDRVVPRLPRRSASRGNSARTRAGRPGAGACHRRQVLLDAERAEDAALLRHPAEPGGGALFRAKAGNVAAGKANGPAEARGQPDHGPDQRRLAGAVPAEDRQRPRLPATARPISSMPTAGAVAGGQSLDGENLSQRSLLAEIGGAHQRIARRFPRASLPRGPLRRRAPRCARRRRRRGPCRAR